MNLYERFWRLIEEKRAAASTPAEELDLQLVAIRPQGDEKSRAAQELSSLVKLGAKGFPPVVASQPSVGVKPFALVFTAAAGALPDFKELFESYVDKNAFVAEVLLLLQAHCDFPYLLFVGSDRFYLFDLATEDILRWGTELEELEGLLLEPLAQRQDIRRCWDELPRKSQIQRAEEFLRWLELWRVAVGARLDSEPRFVQTILQKTVLLFLFDQYFGLSDEDLRLRSNFLAWRKGMRRKKSKASEPFDGVAWLHQASAEVYESYQIDFLVWSERESAFFALMAADARQQFGNFVFELFMLSQAKFSVRVQADAFSSPEARLRMWKFSVTEAMDVRKRLQADDANVYAPIEVDYDESGLGWTLHVVREVLEFWHEKCLQLERDLSDRRRFGVQFDMFQQPDLEQARIPTRADLFQALLPQSVRIYYQDESDRATLEYLLILQIFEFCRTQGIPMQSLENLPQMLVQK